MERATAALVALLAAGCPSGGLADCGVLCVISADCPGAMTCGDQGLCRGPHTTTCETGADAPPGAGDGGTVDAGPVDGVAPDADLCTATELPADDFNDGVPAPSWQVFVTGTGAVVSESFGHLEVAIDGSDAMAMGGYVTRCAQDMKDVRISVEVLRVPTAPAAATFQLETAGGAQVAYVSAQNGFINFSGITGSPYDPQLHRWWRFSVLPTNDIELDTSADALAWDYRGTVHVTALVPYRVRLEAGNNGNASPQTSQFDNLQTP